MKHPNTAALADKARKRTGLTIAQFATLLRSGDRTVADWLAGNKPPQGPALILLALLAAGTLTPDQIREIES